MAQAPKALKDFTDEERSQHLAVMDVAAHNLATLTDQLQTLDNALYDDILEDLDSARVALERKQGIVKESAS